MRFISFVECMRQGYFSGFLILLSALRLLIITRQNVLELMLKDFYVFCKFSPLQKLSTQIKVSIK